MKTLRKTLDRLIEQEKIQEYGGTRNSKLFCIFGTRDNIHYHELLREFVGVMTPKEAKEQLSKYFIKNKDGLMVRK